MQGVVINILFIFLSAEHDKFIYLFCGEFGIERVKHWILLLERLLMIKEFLKQRSCLKKDVKTFQNWMPQLLAYSSNKEFLKQKSCLKKDVNTFQNWMAQLLAYLSNKEFLKQKSCLKKDVKTFQDWMPQLLAYLSNIVNRQHSVKLKLLKFHLMTHIAGDILKWGIPSAYNSSTGESNRKVLKQRSNRT
jgi:hypothetical protein